MSSIDPHWKQEIGEVLEYQMDKIREALNLDKGGFTAARPHAVQLHQLLCIASMREEREDQPPIIMTP